MEREKEGGNGHTCEPGEGTTTKRDQDYNEAVGRKAPDAREREEMFLGERRRRGERSRRGQTLAEIWPFGGIRERERRGTSFSPYMTAGDPHTHEGKGAELQQRRRAIRAKVSGSD